MIFEYALLMAASVTDICYGKVDNRMIVWTAVHIIFSRLLSGEGIYIVSVVLSFLLLLPLYYIRGIGAGDIKLIMVLGIGNEFHVMMRIILISFIVVSVMYVPVVIRKCAAKQFSRTRVPMVPAITMAVIISMWRLMV